MSTTLAFQARLCATASPHSVGQRQPMRYFAAIIVLVFFVLAPNLIWLGTSTVRIKNVTGNPLEFVSYRACEKTHDLGSFGPHEAKFRFLETCGDDTLEIVLNQTKHCQIYVEGELYHVDARITAPNAI